jgi:hypothetical protein
MFISQVFINYLIKELSVSTVAKSTSKLVKSKKYQKAKELAIKKYREKRKGRPFSFVDLAAHLERLGFSH